MSEIERLWHELESLTQGLGEIFAPGAGEEQLRAAEATLGYALPPDLADLYRIHDGEAGVGDSPPLWGAGYLLSLEGMLEERDRYAGVPARYGLGGKLIPILTDFSGNGAYVDRGQVVAFDLDAEERSLLAPSLPALFETAIQALRKGMRQRRELEVRVPDVLRQTVLHVPQLARFGVLAVRIPNEPLAQRERESPFARWGELLADPRRTVAVAVYHPNDPGKGHSAIESVHELWLEDTGLTDGRGREVANMKSQQYLELADLGLVPVFSVSADDPMLEPVELTMRFRYFE